jgi:hypothetical protein
MLAGVAVLSQKELKGNRAAKDVGCAQRFVMRDHGAIGRKQVDRFWQKKGRMFIQEDSFVAVSFCLGAKAYRKRYFPVGCAQEGPGT